MSKREIKMNKLMTEIKRRVKELSKLGYTLSDCASVITLFDDRKFNGRHFTDLTSDEQQETMVDHL